MNRIDKKFRDLKRRRQAALIPFVTAGDPEIRTTLKILHALEAAGADLIELGVPFSDPMADGATIQRASERALAGGTMLPHVLRLVREFRRESELPIILFGYYNPFFHFGLARFAREAEAAGVDGVLCVDLPPEESEELRRETEKRAIHTIFLLAPTSDVERIKLVARRARGFIYYVAVTGVTGARRGLEGELQTQVARIRRHTRLPIGVGFGISTPGQAARIAAFADAAVVGSALIDVIERAGRNGRKAANAGAFVARLKQAIRGVKRPVSSF